MHPVVVKSLQLILAGDIKNAERALVTVAEQEGDQALVSILDALPPKDLLAVMREFDSSKESVVNMVVTPEQFAQAIILEKKYGDRTSEKLRAMINAVIHRDANSTIEYLEAIGELDGGYDTLADYFEDRFDEFIHFASDGTFTLEFDPEALEKAKSITLLSERMEEIDEALNFGDSLASAKPRLSRAEVADGDWMETAWLLRYQLPDDFEQVVITLRDRLQRLIDASLESGMAEKDMAQGASSDEEESAI